MKGDVVCFRCHVVCFPAKMSLSPKGSRVVLCLENRVIMGKGKVYFFTVVNGVVETERIVFIGVVEILLITFVLKFNVSNCVTTSGLYDI